MIDAHGLGALLYSPLAGGLLTGKYREGERGRLSARGNAIEGTGQRTAVVDAVLEIAAETGVDPAQVSLAWLRGRVAVSPTAMITIVGPRTPAHLEGYLASLDFDLDQRHYERLDEVSAPSLGAPHADVAAGLLHGFDGDRSLVDLPAVPVI
jgi:aryl-alcohol dehydrogenase-like predicted oxidoreductase